MIARAATAVDAHVGSRVRLRRKLLKLTQTELAQKLSLTFQQLQKYEKGHNRISAGRLYRISEALDVPISFFFDDLPVDLAPVGGAAITPAEASFDSDVLSKEETSKLLRAYYRIEDPHVRKSIFELVRSVTRSAAKNAK